MTKSTGAFVVALMLMLGLTACDDTAPAKVGPGPPQMLLTYQRSGGLAGLTQMVEVLTDGTATLEGTGGKLNRFEISDERMRQLTVTLEGIDWARADDEPANTMCADCYVYDIAYEGRRMSTTALGNSGRELRDLLTLINTIVSEG